MVCDDDFEDTFAVAAQALAQALDLTLVDSPVLARERPSGVDSGDDHLVVFVKRFEVVLDVSAEFFERLAEAREHVPERHVVVARHDYLRSRQSVEERARLLELRGARALRHVAGDDYERRLGLVHSAHERPDERLVNAPEVKV